MKKEDNDQTPPQFVFNLNALRSLGPAALDHKRNPAIQDIKLRELSIAFDDPLHHEITIRADNILDPTHPPIKIPRNGRLSRAKFEVQCTSASAPQALTIEPPTTLTIECAACLATLLAWLQHTGFAALRTTASTLAPILLALATLIAPALSDNDGDADDFGSDSKIYLN
ncbi:MAG TPA: hypothetical protein VG167_19800 [Verrucomicrobiae bacterium]|nr:hypothetical protein [Verrucomicrobiae bacterium]